MVKAGKAILLASRTASHRYLTSVLRWCMFYWTGCIQEENAPSMILQHKEHVITEVELRKILRHGHAYMDRLRLSQLATNCVGDSSCNIYACNVQHTPRQIKAYCSACCSCSRSRLCLNHWICCCNRPSCIASCIAAKNCSHQCVLCISRRTPASISWV